MKQNLICVVVLSFLALFSNAGGGRFGIVATYDYQSALQNEDVSPFEQSDGTVLRYGKVVGSFDSLYVEQVNDFDAFMESFEPQKRFLVYVHGDHSNLSTLIEKAKCFIENYDVNLLIFAWSSNSIPDALIKNYKTSKQNVGNVLPHFVAFVESFSDCAIAKQFKWSIMFHSLGNLFAKQYARYTIPNSNSHFNPNSVILNAPCVVESEHSFWVEQLVIHSGAELYVAYNSSDRVLKAASDYIEGSNLLGLKPTELAANARYFDFAQMLKGKTNFTESHSFFIGDIVRRIPALRYIYDSMINPL